MRYVLILLISILLILPKGATIVTGNFSFNSLNQTNICAGCFYGETVTTTTTAVTTTTVSSGDSGESEETTTTTTSTTTTSTTTTTTIPKPLLTISANISTVNITQGESKIVTIDAKNRGQTNLTGVKLSLSGINSSVYSINQTTINLNIGETKTYYINFSIPENFSIGVYRINATANNSVSNSTEFNLTVLASQQQKYSINKTYNQFLFLVSEIESNLTNAMALADEDKKLTLGLLLNLTKDMLNETKNEINRGNYIRANELLNSVKQYAEDIQREISSIKEKKKQEESRFFIYVAVFIILLICAFIGYLLWPAKQIKPMYPYSFKPAYKMGVKEKVKKVFEKIKSGLSMLLDRILQALKIKSRQKYQFKFKFKR